MPCCHDNHNTVIELAMQRRAAFSWAGQKAVRSLRSSSLRSRDALHLSSCERSELPSCERSELPSLFNARIFYIFIYIFQAVRRAVNEMFETPDTVFNNLELLVNPSSTAEKCSATEDCCRNPGGDRRPSSTVKYCSATGLLPNRQRGEARRQRIAVQSPKERDARLQQLRTAREQTIAPESTEERQTRLQQLDLLVNRRLRQNRRKRDKPVFNS